MRKLGHLTATAHHLQRVAFHDGNARGIVTAVFKLRQPVQENRCRRLRPRVSNDSAHIPTLSKGADFQLILAPSVMRHRFGDVSERVEEPTFNSFPQDESENVSLTHYRYIQSSCETVGDNESKVRPPTHHRPRPSCETIGFGWRTYLRLIIGTPNHPAKRLAIMSQRYVLRLITGAFSLQGRFAGVTASLR